MPVPRPTEGVAHSLRRSLNPPRGFVPQQYPLPAQRWYAPPAVPASFEERHVFAEVLVGGCKGGRFGPCPTCARKASWRFRNSVL